MTYGINFVNKPIKLSLGDQLVISMFGKALPNCVFIKVTRKGFNILNLDTNRTILKHHLYGKGMAGKEYPVRGNITHKFWVPSYMEIYVKKINKTA